MHIADTDVVVTCPGRNYVIVAIETDDGRVGYGDATLNGREKAVEAALSEHILPELEGRDADRIEDIWQMLFRQTYWRGGPVLNSALSGVDMALWDLKGKRAGMPVYDLLGGRTREYAAVYQHCGSDSVDGIVANVEAARERGVRHFRVNYSGARGEYLNTKKIVDVTREVRERVGPDANLLIDVHGRARPVEAARIATQLEDVGLFFLEDPVRPENPDVFEYLRSHTVTPIAMGELFTNPWEMLPLIQNELVDYIRTDLAHVGGITAGKKLATIGEHHYVNTAFHGPGDLSPIGYVATVHVDLSVPNFGIQELTEHWNRYGEPLADVFEGGHFFVDGAGAVNVPDEPGLGIDVDLAAAREYPYERSHLPMPRYDDGSVRDW